MTTDAQLNPDRCQRERLPAKRDELSPLTPNPPAIRMGQLGGARRLAIRIEAKLRFELQPAKSAGLHPSQKWVPSEKVELVPPCFGPSQDQKTKWNE